MQEEGIEYTDEELQEVINTISKWIVISTDHYSRIKQKTKIISLNSNPTYETKSIPIQGLYLIKRLTLRSTRKSKVNMRKKLGNFSI